MTLLQALLCFWFGGAVAFAGIATMYSKLEPEESERIGLTLFAAVHGTLFWPFALWQGYAAIRERTRERQSELKPVTIEAPPVPCSDCIIRSEEHGRKLTELAKQDPGFCAACKAAHAAWQERVGIEVR